MDQAGVTVFGFAGFLGTGINRPDETERVPSIRKVKSFLEHAIPCCSNWRKAVTLNRAAGDRDIWIHTAVPQ
jgi:hypothetical protein